jgi:hypothetical protein
MAQCAKPRVLWNHKTGIAKEFPSGGAAKRAIELDPSWKYEAPRVSKVRKSWLGRVWEWFVRN